jgi:hypothetical protein
MILAGAFAEMRQEHRLTRGRALNNPEPDRFDTDSCRIPEVAARELRQRWKNVTDGFKVVF